MKTTRPRSKDPRPVSLFVTQLAEAKRPKYNGPYNLARDAEDLCRAAKRLKQIFENQCNGYRIPKQEKKDAQDEAFLRSFVENVAGKYGFTTVHFQTDPRGWPVYLGYDGMTDRNYSTNGIGVPPVTP